MAILEAALVLPVILLVLFAIIELGTTFAQFQVVQNAAREGARAAVLYRQACTVAKVESDVNDAIAQFSNTLGITTISRDALVLLGTPSPGVPTTACNAQLIRVDTSFQKTIPATAGLSRLFGVTQPTLTLRGSSTAATQQSRLAGS
jgi:Flp pilus assembly protein TadG